MSCDILELEILDEYEQNVQINLDFSGDILYLLDQSISKDTLTIKHIHLSNGENKDSVLENYINCMGTISGNGEYLQWYESYDAGEFSSATGLTLKAVQYITYFDGNLQGNRFRRLCQYDWGAEDYVWTEWGLQENFYVTNVGEAMDEKHLSSLIKHDNLPYFFTTGGSFTSRVGKGPFVGARSNNIVNCTNITNGKIWEIDTTRENQPKQINSIQIDQIYIPGSSNAQSGIAVAEAFEVFKRKHQQITEVTLEEVTYMALLEQLETFGAIRFNTGGKDFAGAITNMNLPRGEYLAFYAESSSYCLELTSAIAYRFYGADLFDTGEYSFVVSSPVWQAITDIFNLTHSLGDIDKALDELHTYAQGLVGGATE